MTNIKLPPENISPNIDVESYYEMLSKLRMDIFNKISKAIIDNNVNEAFKWGEVLARTKEL